MKTGKIFKQWWLLMFLGVLFFSGAQIVSAIDTYTCSLWGTTYPDQASCSSACTETRNCTVSDSTVYTSAASDNGYPVWGIQTSGGQIRGFDTGDAYGGWIPLDGSGTSQIGSMNGYGTAGIETSNGQIRYLLIGYTSGAWVSLNGSGTSQVVNSPDVEGIEVSNGQIRFFNNNYGYGAWISLWASSSYSCPLSGGSACSGGPPTCSKTGTCTVSCVPDNGEANICVGVPYWNGCAWVQGTKTCVCTGADPANATLCTGDVSDTSKTVVSACSVPAGSDPKCEYTCNSPYTFSGGTCSCAVSCQPWSACSKTCGGGTQTQDCTDCNGNPILNSQSCNTQACGSSGASWREVAP